MTQSFCLLCRAREDGQHDGRGVGLRLAGHGAEAAGARRGVAEVRDLRVRVRGARDLVLRHVIHDLDGGAASRCHALRRPRRVRVQGRVPRHHLGWRGTAVDGFAAAGTADALPGVHADRHQQEDLPRDHSHHQGRPDGAGLREANGSRGRQEEVVEDSCFFHRVCTQKQEVKADQTTRRALAAVAGRRQHTKMGLETTSVVSRRTGQFFSGRWVPQLSSSRRRRREEAEEEEAKRSCSK
mmetsp:Transcript_9935/g.30137  ORF Transcript_9935/g.30137 Transcript_9935/m.30137 type:complete len:240 (+) Transcript_9935:21-740(+)